MDEFTIFWYSSTEVDIVEKVVTLGHIPKNVDGHLVGFSKAS